MKTFLLFCMAFWIGAANASVIEINAQDTGWYSHTGRHTSDNPNFIAGNIQYYIGATFYSYITHNFFVFDLGNIGEAVTSATLQLHSYDVTGIGTYRLFDVQTPVETLDTDSADAVAIFNDLATGTTYGSIDATPAQSFHTFQITLNQSALNAINSTNGLFAIGGSFTPDIINSYIFGASENTDQIKLILNTRSIPVPQPGTLTLFVIGLLGMGYCRKIKI